jgi:hypothetical protein
MSQANNPESDPTHQLRDLDDEFAAAPNRSSLPSVPDGSYHVRVEGIQITTARVSCRSLLKWKLRILGPSSGGRLLWRNNLLASGPSLHWLKQDLCTCGLLLDKLSDLPNHLDQLLDLELDVTKRTVGDRVNVYLNKRTHPLQPASPTAKRPF